MDIRTHQKVNRNLCGTPLELTPDYCLIEMKATEDMVADDTGLIHGGFVFGAADYAAMLAVNHPHVVLGSSEVKFIKPVQCGDTVRAEARVTEVKDKKRIVSVSCNVEGQEVFAGVMTCFVLAKHVLGNP